MKGYGLSLKETLELHRKMWVDMNEALGGVEHLESDRNEFKKEWCKKHGYEKLKCYCFLCDYGLGHLPKSPYHVMCDFCPMDWSKAKDISSDEPASCCSNYKDIIFSSYYLSAPIEDVLAVPVRQSYLKKLEEENGINP